jgi:hypothetical protein
MSRLHSFEKYRLDELTETIQTVITPSMIGGRNPASPRVVGYNGSNYILFEARSPPSSSSSSNQIWMGNIEKDFSVSGIEPLITSYTTLGLYGVMYNITRDEWWVFVGNYGVSPNQTDLWVYDQNWAFKGKYTNIFSGVSNINGGSWFTPAPFRYNSLADVMDPNVNFAIIKLTNISVLPPATSSRAYTCYNHPWSSVQGTGNYVHEEEYGVRVAEELTPNPYTIKPFFDMLLDPGEFGGTFGNTYQNVPPPYLVPLYPTQDLLMGYLQTYMFETPVHPYVTTIPNGRRYNLFFIDWQQTSNYNPYYSEIKVLPVSGDKFKAKSYKRLMGVPAYNSNLTANPYYTGLILTHGARALNIYLNASVNGTLSIYEYPDPMDFLSGLIGTASPTNASYTSGSAQTVVVDNPSGTVDLSFSPASTPYNLYIWVEVMM